MKVSLNALKNKKNVLAELNITEKNPICVGLDLHKNNVWVAAMSLNEDGPNKIFSKKITIPGCKEDFTDIMATFNEYPCITTVESTYNWYWMADIFEDNEWKLVMANPKTVLQSNLKNNNDETDATCLASHLTTKTLQYSTPLPQDARYFREMNRTRIDFVRQKSRIRTKITTGFANFICEHISGSYIDMLATQIKNDQNSKCLEEHFHNKMQVIHMHELFINLIFLENRIKIIEKQQKEMLKLLDENDPIKQMATSINQNFGCGEVITMTLSSEIGDISRFKESKNFVSYCRLSPTSRMSNGKSKGMGNPKNGNPYLSWAFSEWANYLSNFDKEGKAYYQKLLRKTGNIRAKAIRIFAAKICRGLWYSLKNKEPFDLKRSLGCFTPKA